jgi:predicted phosphodiesterase
MLNYASHFKGNALPGRHHLVIPESTTRHRRIIIIGDVHGCAVELQSLLDKCSYRKDVDIAISVGDLVNKGPSSLSVLKIIKKEQLYAVRGNHDDAALAEYYRFINQNIVPSKEKYQWVTELKSEENSKLVTVLEELPFSLSLSGYRVTVVHAGMVPGKDVEEQELEDLIRVSIIVKGMKPALHFLSFFLSVFDLTRKNKIKLIFLYRCGMLFQRRF